MSQEEPENAAEYQGIVKTILDLKHATEGLQEKRRITKQEIARIEVFGDFSLEDIKAIEQEGHRKIRFFFTKKGIKDQIVLSEDLIYIGTRFDLDYFITITPEKVDYEKTIEMKFDFPLSKLQSNLQRIDGEISEKEKQLKALAKYNQFLHHALIHQDNEFHLKNAQHCARNKIDDSLFAIEGWVPKDKLTELEKVVGELHVLITEISIEEGEMVPTFLENKGVAKLGEDLVHVYDTPSNTDKDPSMWVLLSFALFFGMIINDGGYGLVYLAAALYFKYKNPGLKKEGLRVWKLSAILCTFCIVWGVLTNSFFGIHIGLDSSLKKVSLLNYLTEKKAAYIFEQKDEAYAHWINKYPNLQAAKNSNEFLRGAAKESKGQIRYDMANELSDSILLELALFVGIVHISLSFLRYLGRNWQGAGWILAILGCYLYFPVFLKATTMVHYLFGFDKQEAAQQGYYLMWIGYGLAIVLAIIRSKFLGLLEIMNAIQIFSDVISYVRIYALGLAGAIIGTTINDIAGSIFFLGGVGLFILGHCLNMILSIVGGIIHGLRLNFIEWYHYSFEGGGKLFNPLRKIGIE